jgi:hypothetical protein
MFVFLTGEKERRNPSHFLTVAPGFVTVSDVVAPPSWFERDGAPANLKVEFVFGRAEVDQPLGEWLIKTGYAQRGNLRATGKSLLGALASKIAGASA